MATLTDRLLVLQADGRTSRNNPADTLQVGSAIVLTGTFQAGVPGSERASSFYATTFDVIANATLRLNSSAGAIQIGNDAHAQPIDVGTGAAQRTITVGNSTGNTAIRLDVGTGGLQLGSNATDHPVTLGSTVGASPVTIQAGTGNIDIGANAAARTINVGTGAAAQAINVGTGAAANTVIIGSVTGASATTVRAGTGGLFLTMADNILNAFTLQEGGNAYILVDTLDGSERVVFNTFVGHEAPTGVMMTSSEVIAQYDVVAVLLADPTGRICKADANDANRQNVVGVALNATVGAGVSIRVASMTGTFVTPTFAAPPVAADNGKVVYLDTTAGLVSLVAPAVPGDAVIQVGILVGANGVTANPRVLFQPTFLRIV